MNQLILKNNLYVKYNNEFPLILICPPKIIPKNLLTMSKNYPLKYRYTRFVSQTLDKNKQILEELGILLST